MWPYIRGREVCRPPAFTHSVQQFYPHGFVAVSVMLQVMIQDRGVHFVSQIVVAWPSAALVRWLLCP